MSLQEPFSSRDPSPSTTLGRFSRSRDDIELDIKQPETPVNETAAGVDFAREPSRELKTLGEGPVAPGAAAEAAEGGEEEGEVNPGYKGWLNLLGAVLINLICYGMTSTFGVFQDYYQTHQLASNSATQISWIGSIQYCLCPMLGCISGPLFDAGYLRSLVATGGAIYVVCFMMASIAKEYYQFLLAHGIGVGIGMGLMFSPSVSTLSHHFARSRYRTLAYGCQASGSAIAGIIFPIMLRFLFPAVGFGWAMRIMGFIILLFVIVAFFSLSRVHPPRKKIAVLSPTVFKNPAYTLYVCGAGCISLAIYAPMNFGVTYASANGLSTSMANYSLAISNGCSIVGRIVPLMIAQRVGPINILLTFGITSGVMLFLWTLAKNQSGILAFDAMYGISSGAYAASLNAGAASFAPHPRQSGLYLGMCFFTMAFFWLAGTPATAALIRGKSNYLPATMFCGAVVVLGAALIFFGRLLRVRAVGTKWV